ncbi:1-(5-phosphoribosyl)-5-[(5-phosphoribosylamino)methylideneamino]imidazole-4-carboxamide isomerase [Aliamphritea hakodatensis]|uniref:1-(5-phosphoribosyl)-5-[(5- phosphoribosylamino)methylideneamino]imidazole-4- carboxamide isomerase n=1 Tax=Aliamphritea hakodatensis TaxID=2895352 RepID=UPI0022FD9CB1|nr:1-(5-phosphoribosyl)-5-[(5-phosphoribosylamino)methylideneamino] imidazole-4-carboxamide isomerase [Aliamphritea hakodatensis]
MIIFPDIELMDGKCVNLHHGHLEDPIHYDVDPVETALKFVEQGATNLHLVDLDGVVQGGKHNAEVICEIIEKSGVPVQVGGGIRTMTSAQWWFDHGAKRIVLGTAAVMDRHFLQEVCSHYPGRVVASIDAKDNHVMVNGWRESTAFTPMEVGHALQDSGICALIYTDINYDIDHAEATLATTTEMASELRIPVISSGTVKSLDDISRLQLLPNIAGAIVGRALFNGAVSLEDALRVGSQDVPNPAMM